MARALLILRVNLAWLWSKDGIYFFWLFVILYYSFSLRDYYHLQWKYRTETRKAVFSDFSRHAAPSFLSSDRVMAIMQLLPLPPREDRTQMSWKCQEVFWFIANRLPPVSCLIKIRHTRFGSYYWLFVVRTQFLNNRAAEDVKYCFLALISGLIRVSQSEVSLPCSPN